MELRNDDLLVYDDDGHVCIRRGDEGSLRLAPDEIVWAAQAIVRAGGYRRDRVLVVLDARQYADLQRPGWQPIVEDADLIIGISDVGRPVVLKARLGTDSVEAGVLR